MLDKMNEKEPFYHDEDFVDMKIVNGDDIILSYNRNSKVRCVYVEFAGERPSFWQGFAEEDNDENNWFDVDIEITKTLIEQLTVAILRGEVCSFSFSFEPWGEGHYLNADFANGWAAIFYCDDDEQIYYTPYNVNYDTVEILAPVYIGGQTPVPKMFALDNMELVAKIVSHFLETGQLCSEIQWIKS